MHISFESSGGFAGLRWSSSLDTKELPPEQAAHTVRELEELASAPPAPSAGGSSLPRYRLTIAGATGPQVVELTEAQVPPSLRPLINELMRRARTRRTDGT
jgi:hypothetical protein